jgi:hypothetical protein
MLSAVVSAFLNDSFDSGIKPNISIISLRIHYLLARSPSS